MEERVKTCRTCTEDKPESAFNANAGYADGLDTQCRDCKKAYMDEWHAANRGHRYDITPESYTQMVSDSNGVCSICKEAPEGKRELLVIDHDHETNNVRDLVCHRCNTALGLFRDSPELMEEAANYVRRHRANPRITESIARTETGRRIKTPKTHCIRGHSKQEEFNRANNSACKACMNAASIIRRWTNEGREDIPTIQRLSDDYYARYAGVTASATMRQIEREEANARR